MYMYDGISSVTHQSFSKRNYPPVSSQHLLHINDCLSPWIHVSYCINFTKNIYAIHSKVIYLVDSVTLPLNNWDQNFVTM